MNTNKGYILIYVKITFTIFAKTHRRFGILPSHNGSPCQILYPFYSYDLRIPKSPHSKMWGLYLSYLLQRVGVSLLSNALRCFCLYFPLPNSKCLGRGRAADFITSLYSELPIHT